MARSDMRRKMYFLDKMIDARIKFNDLMQDEEERKVNTELGKQAIVFDIVLLIFLGCAAGLAIWGITMKSDWRIALFIGAIVLVIAMIPYYVLAFNYSIKQLRLNKRTIGWVSLILPIVITIAAIVGIVLVILYLFV